VSIAISILGLALLILVHEAGHFYASLAVGLRPRRFYVGFPPPLVKKERNGIEYCLGAIPLGGFVTIPGMHRPIGHDAERRFSAAIAEVPALAGSVDRVKRSLDGEDFAAAPATLDELEGGLRVAKLSPAARSSAEKGLAELRDALGPDAYWKAPTWKRLVAIGAGPAANILLTIVIFTFLYMTVAGQATTTVATIAPELERGVTSPAKSIGLKPGDRIVAINGEAVKANEVYFLDPTTLQNHHGGLVLVGDHLYAGHGHNKGFPICVDFATGKVSWGGDIRNAGTGSAAVLYADGRLYFRYQNGVVLLVEASPAGYKERGSFTIPEVKNPSWPHLTVADGKLYVREQDTLYCYDVRKAKASGCEWYDLWGVAPPDQPDHSWQQISAFKRKFGGAEVELVPTLDYVLDAAAYERFWRVERKESKGPAALRSPAALAAEA